MPNDQDQNNQSERIHQDNEYDQSIDGLQAALTARATVRGWAEGQQILELVRASHRAGWLDLLHRETTAAEMAAAVTAPAARVEAVLRTLTAAGVVEGSDPYRLAAGFDALVAGASGVELTAVLGAVDLERDRAGRAVCTDSIEPDGEQALALARDWGVRATAGSRQLYDLVYQAVPAYRERLAAGGPLIDAGSGVGGALLTTLTMFDTLRAVGVEFVPEVAAELRSRAEAAGVGDRVEIRAVDARSLSDVETFAVAFWAHEFFAAEARAETLAALFRALQPGGLILMQELFPPEQQTTRAALDRLFFEQQRSVFCRSAKELAEEAQAAGFGRPEIIVSPVGRLVTLQRP
ncbi:SAM-dependent methyltransferase [Microlunatus soli]|uniref:Methyltransferase domain-containing protein n=1 Tax=Microlunatus soli TaxID=630515 RepID=A0A1H1VPG6_9ACTN|nr:class I SAM-dependent methyltransferase [Microlunatus soli]SDS86311.1 Methyltransferase domain-containing protein [Microlunatus soli]